MPEDRSGDNRVIRFDPDAPVGEGRWSRLHIVDIGTRYNEYEPPRMLVPELVVMGYHHLYYGAKENGKTWFILGKIVKPLLEDGRPVIWCDMEMSPPTMAMRFRDLGLRRRYTRNFHYLEAPQLTGERNSRAQWLEYLDDIRPSLVVADAQAGVLAQADLNENATSDVLRWDSWYFQPARRNGAATVMIDHTGHEEGTRARGASGKGAHAKAEMLVKRNTPFSRVNVGQVTVQCKKNTLDAPIPESQTWDLGGSPFLFTRQETRTLTLTSSSEPPAVEKILQVLRREPGKQWKKLEILQETGLSNSTFLRVKVDCLARGMVETVDETPDETGSRARQYCLETDE